MQLEIIKNLVVKIANLKVQVAALIAENKAFHHQQQLMSEASMDEKEEEA